ncbi:LysR family transcriptional regulator [Actinokineospora sp. UTMC 2448]|uniref:LysR family transcriptional regulator n=1 Tax=Actinokineospora sp. UTMC 2448 TaxID=2268449 RepID=UPI002164532D|nr:LysR family transcriptional regulator [Actinokineospora sp. UTMC 2448]UVS79103.1 Hca operon transcriptional activator [Actinokineospora sp. UTMC 2448]
MELELRHLRAITAINDTGSLSKAARRLGMSQPALSAMLQRVERAIGAELFIRGVHGAQVTPLGADVLSEAVAALRAVEEIQRCARSWIDRGGSPDTVRVGGTCGLLPVELSRWMRTQPWAGPVSVQEDIDPHTNVDMVVAGTLDLALVYLPPTSTLTTAQLSVPSAVVFPEEPVFVAMAHDHPLAHEETVSLDTVADFPWIDEPPGHSPWPTYLRQVCRAWGVRLDQQYSTISVSTVRDLLTSTAAVAPVLAPSRNRPDSVVIRPLHGDPLRQELRLFYRPCTVVETHLPRIITQIVHIYDLLIGRNDAFDTWWLKSGRASVA